MYRVRVLAYARRELDKLPEPTKPRVLRAIRALALEPRPSGARLLAGTRRPTWRIRIGDYRILYEIHADELIVLVLGAGHRRDVYRHRRISEIAEARYDAYRGEVGPDDAPQRVADMGGTEQALADFLNLARRSHAGSGAPGRTWKRNDLYDRPVLRGSTTSRHRADESHVSDG